MGSFSFTRADRITKRANLTWGDKYKILIPQEFGGGYIYDEYYDYGYINYDNEAFYFKPNGEKIKIEGVGDLYGVLYYLNASMKDYVDDNGNKHPYEEPTEIFSYILDILNKGKTEEQDIRCKGIKIGCYDKQVDFLKFPLKLVSVSYKGTYEDCKRRSYGDPNQGFFRGYWNHKDYERF